MFQFRVYREEGDEFPLVGAADSMGAVLGLVSKDAKTREASVYRITEFVPGAERVWGGIIVEEGIRFTIEPNTGYPDWEGAFA